MNICFKNISVFWYGGIKPGRKEKFHSVMTRLGIAPEFVEPFISNDPVNAVRIGCGKSHVRALKRSVEKNSPSLILEDDVNSTEWYKESITIPEDADAVYLGTCLNGLHPDWKKRDANCACCSNPILLSRTDEFYRISGMLTTHAILYVTDKYKKHCIEIIEQDDGRNHCDVLMASRMQDFKVYACKKPIFYQDCLNDNKDAYEKTITPLWSMFG